MFDKMQSLPIKYFDTHAHGDIMSTYTNDTDAIRQMIGQSLPMVFQASLTITVMFPHDDLLQRVDDDPGLPVLGAHADGHEEIRRRELPLYDGAAEVARERGRFHRGDDPGTEGRKGVLS